MIKRIVPFALLGLGLISQSACNAQNKGYKKTPGGLEYKIIKDAPGTQKPSYGDQVEMNITVRLVGAKDAKDTTLFSSRQMNNGQPVAFPLEAPKFSGDVSEGFAMLTTGDTAVFRVPVDSVQKANGGQLPPYMKAGSMLEYDVVMVSVKTKEQVMQENEAKASAQKGIDEKALQDYFAKNNIQAQKTASGLYYKIKTPGKGDNAKPGQTVTVNYTGMLMNGNKFDSNTDPEFKHVEPFKFTLGQGQVIKGWDEGISMLNKGAKATLYIPSTLAYGSQDRSPQIPANSVLIFDVELVDAQ